VLIVTAFEARSVSPPAATSMILIVLPALSTRIDQ
jgi:hypothetical protein